LSRILVRTKTRKKKKRKKKRKKKKKKKKKVVFNRVQLFYRIKYATIHRTRISRRN